MSAATENKQNIQTDGLERVQPSVVGIDADAVTALLDDAQTEGLDLHGLLIYRHGKLAVEAYRWPYRMDRPRVSHSVTKSFTSCAIGLALAEGRFSLTERVVSFFPEYLPPVVDANLAAMTVQDLLTMRTGHAEETSGSRWRVIESSWIAEFFKIPVVHTPGAVYVYTSAASYMLSAIITKVTGQTLHDYLKPRLFEPLGIVGERWDVGPDGLNPGGNGLTCKTIDLLKLGILHAQKGIWEGRRILPEEWIVQATRSFGDSGYGFHWVTGPDGEFQALGLFGQMIAVFPAYDAVLVVTSAIGGSHPCSGHLLPLIRKHLSTIFVQDVSDGAAADARLADRIATMATPATPISLATPRPELMGSRSYQFADNPLDVRTISIDIAMDRCTLHLVDASGTHAINVGIDRWIEGETDMPGGHLHHGYNLTPARTIAAARWWSPDILEMTWIFAETAFRDTVVCCFLGDQLILSRAVNVNSGALKQPTLEGNLIAS